MYDCCAGYFQYLHSLFWCWRQGNFSLSSSLKQHRRGRLGILPFLLYVLVACTALQTAPPLHTTTAPLTDTSKATSTNTSTPPPIRTGTPQPFRQPITAGPDQDDFPEGINPLTGQYVA